MHTHHDQEVFRGLVHQLMDAGWYRVGHEERPTGVSWQFRQGHTLDAGAEIERWILAPDEMTAMRIVMEEIRIERPEEPQRGFPRVARIPAGEESGSGSQTGCSLTRKQCLPDILTGGCFNDIRQATVAVVRAKLAQRRRGWREIPLGPYLHDQLLDGFPALHA